MEKMQLTFERKKYEKPESLPVTRGNINCIPVTHRAAIATFSRMSPEDFSHLKFAKGDKDVFKEKVRQLWSEVAVHGLFRKDRKTNQPFLASFSDLDGKTCLGLLKEAGINVRDVKYVPPGQYVPGRINFDTGDRYGFMVEDGGQTVFLDHHGPEAKHDTSGAKITYETLVELGLLAKTEYMDKLIEFVTQVDNKSFPLERFNFWVSHRTLIGLNRFAKFDKMIEFFKQGKNPDDYLTNQQLVEFGFVDKAKNIDYSNEQKRSIAQSHEQFLKLKGAGFVVPSKRFGNIVVDIGKSINAGYDAIKAEGCETYIIWDERDQSFFISTSNNKTLPDLSQGVKVRNSMYKKNKGGEPLILTLEEVLLVLTDGDFKPERKLAQYLEKKAGEAEVASVEAASA